MITVLAILQGVTAVATLHPSQPSPAIVALESPRATGITILPASPPPVLRTAGDVYMPPVASVATVPIRVRVMAGGQQLFSDTLRVGRNASASYQESRSEAPSVVCTNERYYGSSERYSLNINVVLRDENPGSQAVNVSVTWQRPSRPVGCGSEGTRQVQLTQTVPLAPGQSATIEGDAGLAVTISR